MSLSTWKRKGSRRVLYTVCAAVLAFVLLVGSAAEPIAAATGTTASTASNQNTKVKVTSLAKKISKTMPVIAIQTKSKAADNLRFVDETVAKHVAQQKAGWTQGFVMPPEPYYEDCLITVLNKGSKKSISNAEAKVKVRGNWTTDYPKKSLRVKFSKKTGLLGLNKGREYKNWVLLASYKDGSMLRDKTAFQIANAILGKDGLYASDCELVTVFINGGYRGIYLLAEYQQLNEGRIEGKEAEDNYKGTDIGYLLELDGYCKYEDELNRFYISYNNNAPLKPYDGNNGSGRTIKYLPENDWDPKDRIGFTIKSDIYSKEQNEFIKNFMENTYKILYEAAYNNTAYVFDKDYRTIKKTTKITPKKAIERVVDVKSLADMYIISELSCDADLYYSSFYMSVDFSKNGKKKLTFQAPWDFDSAFGLKNRCIDGQGYYASNIIPDVNGFTDYGGSFETINPWLAVLSYQDWFRDIVKKKWNRAVDSGVFKKALKMISSDTRKLKKEFARNYKKWNNLIDNGSFYGELSDRQRQCRTQADASKWLSEWLTKRVEFLNSKWKK